jgi:hypothetical protein
MPTSTLYNWDPYQQAAQQQQQKKNDLAQSALTSAIPGAGGLDSSQLTSQSVQALLGYQNDITSDQNSEALDNARAAQDELSAEGYGQEASAYGKAAGIAGLNSNLALVSGDIQEAQENRKIYKTISGQKADIAGSGFGGGTTALALYADSMQQGNLATSLIQTNAQIQSGGYQQAQEAALAEEAGATTAANYAESAVGIDQLMAKQASEAGARAQTDLTNLTSALSGSSSRSDYGSNLAMTNAYVNAQTSLNGGRGPHAYTGTNQAPGEVYNFNVVNPDFQPDSADRALGLGPFV